MKNIKTALYALESYAHLNGKEGEFLPMIDAAREELKALTEKTLLTDAAPELLAALHSFVKACEVDRVPLCVSGGDPSTIARALSKARTAIAATAP